MLPTTAIVGATGAVGREMLTCFEQRRFKHGPLKLLASARSAGAKIPYRGEQLAIEELTPESLKGVRLALFSASSGISKQFGPTAAAQGTVIVDNSSAFRMDPKIALVVPEVNPQHLPKIGPTDGVIIANPNCSTIIALVALTPIHKAFGIERFVAATYQAASGAGAQAMEELSHQTREVLAGRPAQPRIFHEPYAFNLFSHNSAVDPVTGMNVEEQKMIAETHKMWGDSSVRISATCVRVPVLRAHCEAINITLRKAITLAQLRESLAGAPGLRILDDRKNNLFPTPLKASGQGDVLVGRLRADPSQLPTGTSPDAPTRGFDLFVAGDQLLKGAALNAVQIAELMLPECRG
ncbi:MAG: aspartate-semialdehyde dehydrogenase [Phycisphaerales bacterium]